MPATFTQFGEGFDDRRNQFDRSPYRTATAAGRRAPRNGIQTAADNLGNIDFTQFEGLLSNLAQSVTDDLFRPGGAVESATGGALRSSVASGFGPSSGGFDAARLNILQSATDRVSNVVGQGALSLAPLALQQRESQFGAEATLEQLLLAKEQLRLNEKALGRGWGDRLGGAAKGALIGAAIGGPAAPFTSTVGGIIGGLAGLFGG